MKCTVLLPVYGGEATLRASIASVLGQTCSEFELLIIDDASRDGSADLAAALAAGDPRIRLIRHASNLGLARTLNEGLERASCELVARLDQDDEMLPERLRVQLDFMAARPEVAVAGSYVRHMGRNERRDRLVELPVSHEEIAAELRTRNCIYHPAVMLRRSVILACGGYRYQFRNSEDYDLWLRLSRAHRLANIPAALTRYRFSTSGMTLSHKWEQYFYSELAKASFGHPETPLEDLEPRVRQRMTDSERSWFLEQVALGTVCELLRLGLWRDAWRTYRLFRPDLARSQRSRLLKHAAATALRR